MFFIAQTIVKGGSSHLLRSHMALSTPSCLLWLMRAPFQNKLDQTVIVVVIYINIVCFFHINRGIFTLISDLHEETSPVVKLWREFLPKIMNYIRREWRDLSNYFLITFTTAPLICTRRTGVRLKQHLRVKLTQTKTKQHSLTIYFMCFLYITTSLCFYFYLTTKNCTFFPFFNMIVTIKLMLPFSSEPPWKWFSKWPFLWFIIWILINTSKFANKKVVKFLCVFYEHRKNR